MENHWIWIGHWILEFTIMECDSSPFHIYLEVKSKIPGKVNPGSIEISFTTLETVVKCEYLIRGGHAHIWIAPAGRINGEGIHFWRFGKAIILGKSTTQSKQLLCFSFLPTTPNKSRLARLQFILEMWELFSASTSPSFSLCQIINPSTDPLHCSLRHWPCDGTKWLVPHCRTPEWANTMRLHFTAHFSLVSLRIFVRNCLWLVEFCHQTAMADESVDWNSTLASTHSQEQY